MAYQANNGGRMNDQKGRYYSFILPAMMMVLLFATACQTALSSPSPHRLALSSNPVTLYTNGDILTMAGPVPAYVEVLAEQDGKIIFAGSAKVAEATFDAALGPPVTIYDLKGQTLLPAFIDSHSHMYQTGLTALLANLRAVPDGKVDNYDSLVQVMRGWSDSETGQDIIDNWGWIVGNGYDDSQLAEQAHPTRVVLDRISTTHPVLVIHQSAHWGVVNTKGLEVLGLTKASPDPDGGVIHRYKDGTPNGVLEEKAFFAAIFPLLGAIKPAMEEAVIEAAQLEYARHGYLTVQDGRTLPGQLKSLMRAAERGQFYVDVVAYPDIELLGDGPLDPAYYSPQHSYNHHFRIGGVKLTLDGSPQGKTAWLSQPYFVPPPGMDETYTGYGVLDDKAVQAYINEAFDNRWPILVHANGDAAIDQLIMALKRAQADYGYPDLRPVLIHGQTLRHDQIKALKSLRVRPSLFPLHTFYWGDWHRRSVLGPKRAAYISPMRDVLAAGLNPTAHHDAPVTPPNALRVIDASVNRTSRTGEILGSDQRLTPYEALKTQTIWAAEQYYEQGHKGTLEPGKQADFVIMSDNPLKVDPAQIKTLSVITAIKAGQPVYPQRN